MSTFGESSVFIFMSIFGGSTFLLFLICFCCHKKLQARTLAMAEITDLESQQRRQATHRRSDTHGLIPSIVTPPPDYEAVMKKESVGETGLPTYEVAMQDVRSNSHI